MSGTQHTKLRPCIGRFCKVFSILILVGGCSLLSASVKKIPDGFLSVKRGSDDVKQGLYMELPWEGFDRYNMPTQSEVKIPTLTKFDGTLSRLRSLKVSRDCKVKYKIKNTRAFVRHLKVKNMDVVDFNKALVVIYTRAAETGKLTSLKELYPFLELAQMFCKTKPTFFKFKNRDDCMNNMNYELTELTVNGTHVPIKNTYVYV